MITSKSAPTTACDAIELQAGTESVYDRVFILKATQSFCNSNQNGSTYHEIPYTYYQKNDQNKAVHFFVLLL